MRILLAVCGEGFGHSSRCMKLAKYLERHGHKTIFASYDKAYDFIKDHGFKVFKTCREVTLEGSGGYFDFAKSLKSSIGMPKALFNSFIDIRRLIKREKIELVIADTMFAAGAAAKTLGLPLIFITNQNHFSSPTEPNALHWNLFSKIITAYHHIVPNIIAVPDFPPPYTICGYNFKIKDGDKKYKFVGPIIDDRIKQYNETQETVFASFGGGTFKLPLYTMLSEIAKRRPELKFEIFSATKGFPKNTENFIASEFIDNVFPNMAKAKTAIVHGGLTSLHELTYYNKPLILIIDPYHPEEGNNGRKIVETGRGIMLYGNTVTEDILSEAIDKAAAMKPENYKGLYEKYSGAAGIEELIEELTKH